MFKIKKILNDVLLILFFSIMALLFCTLIFYGELIFQMYVRGLL